MQDAHKNFAYSSVLTAPSPATSGTSLTLAAGGGALMPATPFNGVAWPTGVQPLSTNAEVVRVTDVTGDVLTIARAQESSTARTIIVGDQFAANITRKLILDVEQIPLISQGNHIIEAGRGVYVPDEYEIALGHELEIEAGAVLELG